MPVPPRVGNRENESQNVSFPGFLMHLFDLFMQEELTQLLLCVQHWALFLVSLVKDVEPQETLIGCLPPTPPQTSKKGL